MSVDVFAANEQSDQPVDTMRWVRLAEAVLDAEGVKGDAEVSLLFVDEPAIADLNKRFLGKEGPTDVLSFPIDEAGEAHGERELGDVVISPEQTEDLREAVVHGVLHLTGMDHETDDGEMLALQAEILSW